jgi:hypothetical protein
MRDEKALVLFQKVLQKTRQGQLKWQATAEENEYITPLGEKRYLRIFPFTELDAYGNQTGPTSVSLVNEKDELLVDMTSNVDGIALDELKELELMAKRQALRIDEQVDEVLKELDKLDDIPF